MGAMSLFLRTVLLPTVVTRIAVELYQKYNILCINLSLQKKQ
jgi:hypothetical protein